MDKRITFLRSPMPNLVSMPPEPLLLAAQSALPKGLGLAWEIVPGSSDSGESRDRLAIRWEDREKIFQIVVRRIHRAEDLGRIKASHPAAEDVLLLTPYLTENLARKCVELGIPFLDGAGNAFLTGPGLRILHVGERPKPDLAATLVPRPFRPYSSKGLQVIFTLLSAPALTNATYRELAKAAGVARGTVGMVLKDLLEAGLVADLPGGRVIIHFQRLLEAWVANYPQKLRPHLGSMKFRMAIHQDWRSVDFATLGALVSGEAGGDRLTAQLQPMGARIYTREPFGKIATALRLRPDPEGTIELLERFWDFPNPKDIPPGVAPPLLVYGDLIASGEPRNLDIARMIHETYLNPPGTRA